MAVLGGWAQFSYRGAAGVVGAEERSFEGRSSSATRSQSSESSDLYPSYPGVCRAPLQVCNKPAEVCRTPLQVCRTPLPVCRIPPSVCRTLVYTTCTHNKWAYRGAAGVVGADERSFEGRSSSQLVCWSRAPLSVCRTPPPPKCVVHPPTCVVHHSKCVIYPPPQVRRTPHQVCRTPP